VAQEKYKGTNGPLGLVFRSATAGWAFPTEQENPDAYYQYVNEPGAPASLRLPAQADENGYSTSKLPTAPFFKPFQASETGDYYPNYQGVKLMAPLGDSDADNEARKLVTQAKCLAEGIPALSYAQGSNPAARYHFGGVNRNFDLNTNYNASDSSGFKNGWPASRLNDQNWKHGDYIQVAYYFVYPLYTKIVNDGGLK